MWRDQIETIGKRLGVTKQDVIDMNRWFGGDASLNAAIPANGRTGLVDEAASQETTLAARGERSAYSRSRAAHLRSASARRGPDHACGLSRRIRRLQRARAPDRREFVREGAEGGEKPRRHNRNTGTYRELSRAACRNVATAAEILEIRWKCCKPNRNKNLRNS